MKLLMIIITILLSTKLYSEQRHSGIELKEMKGKVMLYRKGAHFQYDGVKMLRTGDVLQTLANSTITIEVAHFQVSLAPLSFFELRPSENKYEIYIGRFIYGSMLGNLSTVTTDKKYVIYGPQFTSKVNRSQVIYTVTRSRRELQQTLRGKIPMAIDFLKDAKELAFTPGLSTQISVLYGSTLITLGNKTLHTIVQDNYLEYRGAGIAIKTKEAGQKKIKGYLDTLRLKLFLPLKGEL